MANMLAFDFGAASGRAILGSLEKGKLKIQEVHRFLNEPVKFSGHLQWDILRLCFEIKQGIIKCRQASNSKIDSIAVDTWGVDFGLLDKEGELIENPFHYRDERTNGMVERCLEIIGKDELYSRTGIGFTQYNTVYQLLAMKCLGSRALEIAETILLMPDLFNYFLTGEKYAEYTEATTSQLYDHSSGNWDYNTINKLRLPEKIFPKIILPGTRISLLKEEISNELSVRRIPVIAVAGHDTASAIVSIPASDENFIYISTGTWIMVGVENPEPILSEKALLNNFTNEGGFGGKITFQKNMMGTWILQECRRQWGEHPAESLSFDKIINMARNSSAESWIDPDDNTFFTPGNMPKKIMEFCKKTGQHSPESIGETARCIEESLAFKCRFNIEFIEEITGRKTDKIHIFGGGIQDELLCRLIADVTQKKVIAGPVEATAIGNILIQGISLGIIKDIHEARAMVRNSFEIKEYIPIENKNILEKYSKFLKIL